MCTLVRADTHKALGACAYACAGTGGCAGVCARGCGHVRWCGLMLVRKRAFVRIRVGLGVRVLEPIGELECVQLHELVRTRK